MVITAPVVGKLSRQSFEQIVGTLIGGILGYTTWLVIDAFALNKDAFILSTCLSLCSAAMGFFNVVIEESLSDANMTAVTYLSVVFGTAESSTGTVGCKQMTCKKMCSFVHALLCSFDWCDLHAELLLPAVTRVAGIIGGVLLSLMLSVILWPKSASEQSMK